MKNIPPTFASECLAGLCEHLATKTGPPPEASRDLGLSALAPGLDTLDLAKVHESAWNEHFPMRIGFRPGAPRASRKFDHLGLPGMRERVEMAGETFSIASAPGEETTIRVEWPRDHGAKNKKDRRRSP